MKVFGNIPDRPFGWPEGTVRAILAFMVILGAMIAFIFTHKLSEGTFVALITGVLGYFFGSASAKTAPPPTIIAASDPSSLSVITPGQVPPVPAPVVTTVPAPDGDTSGEVQG